MIWEKQTSSQAKPPSPGIIRKNCTFSNLQCTRERVAGRGLERSEHTHALARGPPAHVHELAPGGALAGDLLTGGRRAARAVDHVVAVGAPRRQRRVLRRLGSGERIARESARARREARNSERHYEGREQPVRAAGGRHACVRLERGRCGGERLGTAPTTPQAPPEQHSGPSLSLLVMLDPTSGLEMER